MDAQERIQGEEFYDLITGEELSWQALIYDLIKTEQLDPWDIDLTHITPFKRITNPFASTNSF
jgi:hypothetical protein